MCERNVDRQHHHSVLEPQSTNSVSSIFLVAPGATTLEPLTFLLNNQLPNSVGFSIVLQVTAKLMLFPFFVDNTRSPCLAALAMGGTGRVVSKEEDINIIACLRKAGLDRFVDQELGEWSDGW